MIILIYGIVYEKIVGFVKYYLLFSFYSQRDFHHAGF